MNRALGFEVTAREGAARRGRFRLPHGVIETPTFMPVGTYGTVKGLTPGGSARRLSARRSSSAIPFTCCCGRDLRSSACNGRRPAWVHGLEVSDSDRLRRFSGVQPDQPARQIDEDGVSFRSPVDGAAIRMRPEDSMDVQRVLRSDVAMAFDECTGYPVTFEHARESMQRSMRWALRSFDHFTIAMSHPDISLASCRRDVRTGLRLESIEALSRRAFPGLRHRRTGGRGGRGGAVTDARGRGAGIFRRTGRAHLMGVGYPQDIVAAVARGVGHVRLRDPDPPCPQWTSVLPPPESSISAMRCISVTPGRSTLHLQLFHLSALLPRVPAPPGSLQRDPRGPPGDPAQRVHFYLNLMREIRARDRGRQLRAAGGASIGGAPANRDAPWHNAPPFAEGSLRERA